MREEYHNSPKKRAAPFKAAVARSRPWGVFGADIEDAPAAKFNMVSMFSGCGGADLGLRFAGFNVLWANDIDAAACDTYRRNIRDIIKCGDIRQIGLPRELKGAGVDLLAACFPCQSFSNAGARRGTDDENGQLNNWAIRAVNHFNPKVVVYENVRGMLSIRDSGKLLVEKICNKLRRRGYNAYIRLLNASEHYVPQKRMRVFIVGVRADADLGEFGFPIANEADGLTLGDTIMDVPKDAANYADKISLGPSAAKMCKKIPPYGSWKNLDDKDLSKRFIYIRRHPELYRAPNFYRRFGQKEIAGTITAAFKPEHSGVLHPTRKRAYSVREAARIQSFPDWFAFHGSGAAAMCRQVGNAVPPRLAYEIGDAVARLLSGDPIKEPREKIALSQFIKEGRPLRLSSPTIKHEKRRTS